MGDGRSKLKAASPSAPIKAERLFALRKTVFCIWNAGRGKVMHFLH